MRLVELLHFDERNLIIHLYSERTSVLNKSLMEVLIIEEVKVPIVFTSDDLIECLPGRVKPSLLLKKSLLNRLAHNHILQCLKLLNQVNLKDSKFSVNDENLIHLCLITH
jgi:hypothetical protein